MSDRNDYYKVLGLPENSSLAEVRQAYKELVQVWNPERFSHDPQLQQRARSTLDEIDEAFDNLITLLAVKESSQQELNVTPTQETPLLGQEEKIDHETREEQAAKSVPVEINTSPKSFVDTYFPSKTFRGCMWLLMILVVRVLFSLIGTFFGNSNAPTNIVTWTKFTNETGAYNCLEPGSVTETVKNQNTGDGPLEQHISICDTGKEGYSVIVSSYSPTVKFEGSELERAEGAVKIYSDLKHIQALYDVIATSGKHSGREIRYYDTVNKVTVMMQIFAVKNRSFIVSYAATIGRVNNDNAKKFFESFQINDSK